MKNPDHLEERISEALRVCLSADPKVGMKISRLLGRTGDLPAECSSADADRSLMAALRPFVTVAYEIDDVRVGAVLASIRYLAACIATRSQAGDAIH